jgi:chromosome segregation ATPase
MINIKEKDGKIIFNDTQEFNQDNLLVKYRNDEMTKKLLESQLVKLPERITQTEAQKGMIQDRISQIEDRLIIFEEIFKIRNLNPKEELNKLREKYTDEELTKKSEQISEKQTFQVKDNGHSISRITKNEFTIEELIIIYASNQYNKIQAEEKIIQIDTDIERTKTRLKANEEELEKVNNSIHSIKQYFKAKRLNLDKLLEDQAKNREKGKKDVGEIKL